MARASKGGHAALDPGRSAARALTGALFAASLTACSDAATSDRASSASSTSDGGAGASTAAGTGGAGAGPVVTCPDENAPGPRVDLAWPSSTNTGHDANEGDTVHFHWSGAHGVAEAATFEGQVPPLSPYADAMWPGEIASGPQAKSGEFDWNTGTFPCGYRPGLYFFVDPGVPASGVVAVSLTLAQGAHNADMPCAALARPDVFGGAYASYAGRAGSVVHQVDNFQTETHFDWFPPTVTARQGDVVVFRWTGEHNVVQVHDASADSLYAGGLHSGPKTNCVGGPQYSCVEGTGEFLFDTKDYHPGIVHISDECALTCTGHATGMNMEVDVRYDVPLDTPQTPIAGTCCAVDPSKGDACRVVQITNANDGAQLDYNVGVGRGDLVRFSWAGSLRIYQVQPNADGSPSDTAKPNGLAMPAALECIPGPHETCLGAPVRVEFVFDVDKAIQAGQADQNAQGQYFFDFAAKGDVGQGATSADTHTIVYVTDAVPFDPTPPPCSP